ncbi:hypothetical protein AB205_0003570, partial [Aquarana catesbeiana]
MVFDAWMQQWYLFYLVQNPETPTPTPAQNPKTPQPTPAPTGVGDLLEMWKDNDRLSENLVYASTSYSTDTEPSIIDESPS